MSRKMTNEIRQAIVKAAKKHRFQAAEDELRKREIDLGRRIYDATYDERVRNLMNQMPDGIIDTDAVVWFNNDEGHRDSLPLGESRPVSHLAGRWSRHHDYCIRIESDLAADYRKLVEDSRALEKEKELAASTMRSALASYTTVKKLLEAWPEIEPFLPDWDLAAPNRQLPVPEVKKLNEMFKLPVESNDSAAVAA